MRYIKINFHILNILLILFYLFPGSILGCIFYNDCSIQPKLTRDFLVSSNHLYVFILLSISFFLPFWKAYVSLIGLTSHQRLFSYMTIATCLSAVVSTALMGVLASFSLFYLFLSFGLVMILAVVIFQVAERLRKYS